MNYDSREAALGLLDLGSLGTGMDGGGEGKGAVAGSSNLGSMQTKKTVPTKRKQGAGGKKEVRGGGSATGTSTTGGGGGGKRRRSASIHWTSSDEAPEKPTSITADSSTDAIRCICGLTYDDGFSIACDACSRWCHAACFDIVEGGVPEEWWCWECQPREVDRERAVRLQKARIRVLEEGKRRKAEEEREREREKVKRKGSPGMERKRRASAAAIEGGGGKRRRRLSVMQPHQQLHQSQQQHIVGPQQHPSGEDEHVDIDSEPWTAGYIPISHDLISQTDVRTKLRRHAQDWRGVTALSTPSMASQSFSPFSQPTTPVFIDPHVPLPQTHIKMLPPGAATHPALATHTHLSVHPPTYALHTASPVSSSSLIAKYTSCITPSSVYLSDPLNAYAHMGMPKPFVHVMGPPLDLALDARRVGSEARFARNGCHPNAVLRPVLCKKTGKEAKEDVTTEEDHEYVRKGDTGKRKEDAGDSLTFGIFALQDIKANEEIVLGWEWDDGNVVHHLPALMENPHSFPSIDTLLNMASFLSANRNEIRTHPERQPQHRPQPSPPPACQPRHRAGSPRRHEHSMYSNPHPDQPTSPMGYDNYDYLNDHQPRFNNTHEHEHDHYYPDYDTSYPHPEYRHHHYPHRPDPCNAQPNNSPYELYLFRKQLAGILHTLASSFATCACGARAKDCVITQIAAVVDGETMGELWDSDGLGYAYPDTPNLVAANGSRRHVDLGPLVGVERGFRTRERVPFSGGIGGVEMCVDEWTERRERDEDRGRERGRGKVGHTKVKGKRKGKERQRDVVDKEKRKARVVEVHRWDTHDEGGDVDGDETEVEVDMYGRSIESSARIRDYRSCSPPSRIIVRSPSPSSSSSMHSTRFELHLPGPPHGIRVEHLPEQAEVTSEAMEEEMPPKLRKRWIHKEAEALKGAPGTVDTAASWVQNMTGNGVAMTDLGIMQTGSRAVIRSHEEQEVSLPPSGVVAVPSTSPSDSFAKLSLRSPAILTSSTRVAGRFAVAAAPMESPMHSWSPFKRVQDAPADGGDETSEDVLRDGQAKPTSTASLKFPSKHSPPTIKTALPVSSTVSVGVLHASPPHLSKQLSSEMPQSSPSTLRANARPSFKLASSAMSIHSLLSPSPSLRLSPKPSLSSIYAQEDISTYSSSQPSLAVEENTSQRPPSPPLSNQFDRLPSPSVIHEGNENTMDVDPSPLIPELKLRSHDTLQMEQQQEGECATIVSQPPTPASATSHPVEHAVSSPLSPPPPSSPTAKMRDPSQSPTTPPTQQYLSARTTLPPLFSVATPPPTTSVSYSPLPSPSSQRSVIQSLSPVTAMTSLPIHQTRTLTATPECEGPPPASAESPSDQLPACSPSPDLAHNPPHIPEQSLSAECVSPRLHVQSPSPPPSLQPAPARPPSPPLAPKVKMSLKDFAMRKKKMREEGLTKSMQASPMSTTSALGTEMDEGGSVIERGVALSDIAQDAVDCIEAEEQAAGLVKSHAKPASTDDEVVKAGDMVEMNAKHLPASLDGLHSASPVDIDRLSSVTTSDVHSIFVTAPVLPDAKMNDEPYIQISKPAEPTRVNGHPPLASSTLHNSKTDQSDDPVAASAQPKLPPSIEPPATKEAKAELIEDVLPPESTSTSLPTPPPTTAASKIDIGFHPTLQPSPLPSNTLVPQPPSLPPLLSTLLPPPAVRLSQVPPPLNIHPRQFISQEEGEIPHVEEMPFPRHTDLGKPRLPRSSPPTQPRLFHATTASSPLPITHGQQIPYQSPGSSQHSSSASRFSRPIPSAPRALRNSALFAQSNQSAYSTPPPHLPTRSYSGSHYTPRGPSADRDYQRGRQLEWDREDRRQFHSHSKMVSKGGSGSGSWNR